MISSIIVLHREGHLISAYLPCSPFVQTISSSALALTLTRENSHGAEAKGKGPMAGSHRANFETIFLAQGFFAYNPTCKI